MHIVTNSEPIHTGNLFGTIMPGRWVMRDQNVFEMGLISPRGSIRAYSIESSREITGDNILIFHPGGYGDLLLSSPAYREFRQQFPGKHLTLCTTPARIALFDGTEIFDEIIEYPISAERFFEFSSVISMEDLIENETELQTTDLIASHLGIAVRDYKPAFVLTDEERAEARNHFTGVRPRIAIQLRAGVRNRDYPAHLWQPIILGLEEAGWEVLLVGTPDQVPPLPPALRRPYIVELYRKELTFRENAAILSWCNAFAGPDSSLIHLCHALDIPAIGLFGAFPWKIRTKHAPKTRVLTGEGECVGCCWNFHAGRHFPPNKPCSGRQLCSVLETIEPKRVLAKIAELKP